MSREPPAENRSWLMDDLWKSTELAREEIRKRMASGGRPYTPQPSLIYDSSKSVISSAN